MFKRTITVYHKTFDKEQREDVFVRTVIKGVHFEHSKALNVSGTKLHASDDVEIVIPHEHLTNDLAIKKDDVVVLGEVEKDIEDIHDLEGHDFYKVRAIHYNDYALIDYLNNWTVIAQ